MVRRRIEVVKLSSPLDCRMNEGYDSSFVSSWLQNNRPRGSFPPQLLVHPNFLHTDISNFAPHIHTKGEMYLRVSMLRLTLRSLANADRPSRPMKLDDRSMLFTLWLFISACAIATAPLSLVSLKRVYTTGIFGVSIPYSIYRQVDGRKGCVDAFIEKVSYRDTLDLLPTSRLLQESRPLDS